MRHPPPPPRRVVDTSGNVVSDARDRVIRTVRTSGIVTRTRRNAAYTTLETAKIVRHSLAWVCGLAWNSAFQTTFENVEFLSVCGPWAYAFLITVFSVGVIGCLNRWLRRLEEPQGT